MATIECGTACAVTLKLEASPANEEHLEALNEAWYLFFGVAIVVICLRKLYRIFDGGPDGDK